MSVEAITAALYCSESKAGAKLVLVAIADGIGRGTDCWYAYVDEIAEVASYSRRFTTSQITRLVNAGELVVEPVGGKRCNYYIPLLPGEEGYEPQECNEKHFCSRWHTPLAIGRTATARKNRRARQQAAKKFQRPPRNDGSYVPSFLGDSEGSPRNDDSYVPGTIVPRCQERSFLGARNDRSSQVPIEVFSGLIPGTIPVEIPTRVRATPPSEKKEIEAEREPDPIPPPPPLAQRPDVPEARLAWREVRLGLAGKISPAVLSAWGPSCHLYPVGPGQWQLRLGTGVNVAMFRARFEALITDQLCAYAREGNQLLQIVGAT
jgi:hypothetical protein